MLLRKSRRASNTWYKLGRPMINSGEQAGQRDQERIVVSIQIVPDDVFNEYGDRKVTGFTLKEIAEMVETGQGKTIWSNPEDQIEGIPLTSISVGDGMNQVTITELKQILTEMGGSVLSTPSPLDDKDRARMRGEKEPEVKVVVVQGQTGPQQGEGEETPEPRQEIGDPPKVEVQGSQEDANADSSSSISNEPPGARATRGKTAGARTGTE